VAGSGRPRKVLLTWYARADELRTVQAALPAGTSVVAPAERPHLSRFETNHEDLAKDAADADAMMGWVLPPGILDAATRLRALVWLHAGCDELDFGALKHRGVQVANARGANAIAVAEHALALMLGLAKKLLLKHQAVLEARWTPGWEPQHAGVLLEGKTLAVVGLGQIGSAVARRAKGFDMRVLGVRRHPERGGAPDVDSVFGPRDLNRVLGEADVVVLAVPITRETRAMIDDAALAAMKPTALLVNVARGNLVLERPLHAALTEGRLAGYAADVWWHYEHALPATYHFPIPSRTGVQRLPNVLATGNQASHTPEIRARCLAMGTESLAAFVRGEPMPRTIDLDLGY
jgi:phosphoglycerate dehydrogenase-like enzyme